MFNNIEIFKKEGFRSLKFEGIPSSEFVENQRLVPIGADEIHDFIAHAPVIITGGNNSEFALFSGIVSNGTIFNKTDFINKPDIIKTYPFTMVKVKNEDDKLMNIIGVDINEKYVSNVEGSDFFDKDENLSEESKDKIDILKNLYQKRELSKVIIANLKEKNLLDKQDFKLNIDGNAQNILTDFYIVNRKKLYELDKETLVLWSKKGWLSLLDAHLHSLKHFQKLVDILS
jgi:hypothetical protein